MRSKSEENERQASYAKNVVRMISKDGNLATLYEQSHAAMAFCILWLAACGLPNVCVICEEVVLACLPLFPNGIMVFLCCIFRLLLQPGNRPTHP